MRRRRAAFLLGAAAALAAGLTIRLATRPQIASGTRVRALSSDAYYHLRRARFAAAHFPRTIVFDPLMNYPEGGVPIWPPLYDLALAAPALLAHGRSAGADAIERGAAWVPLVFAAGSILLAGAMGNLLFGSAGGIAAALLVACAPGHILWTQFGHTDQHAAESFFGLLVIFLFVSSRRDPRSPAGLRREVAAGAALGLAVITWQGAICWGAVIALSLALEAVTRRATVARAALATLGTAAGLSLAGTAAWLGGRELPFTYVSFGYFQPLFLASLAAGTILLDTLLAAGRRQLSRRAMAARILGLSAAALAALPFADELAGGLFAGVGYVMRQTKEAAGPGGYVSYPSAWLKGIFETRPLLADGLGLPLRQLSAAFLLAPLAVLLWAARALRRIRPGMHWALAVWGGVSLFLAFSQRLNVYYAAPVCALAAAEGARQAATRLRRRVNRAKRPRRGVVFAGVLIVLALPMVPGIRGELRAVRVPGSDLFATLDWMREELPHGTDPYDSDLLAASPRDRRFADGWAVMGPWSLGHLVLYNAELPVVANNFGYGFLDSIRFFLATSEEEALAIARARRVRWVLVTDLAPRMNDYAGYLGRRGVLEDTSGGPRPLPAYFQTMQSRLYDFDGRGGRAGGIEIAPLEGFRLIHQSASAIPRGGRWLARWKVFEIVPVD
ncbi:MAG: STT3 domain-containing protein [Thermoanaerobaculia bacterium]